LKPKQVVRAPKITFPERINSDITTAWEQAESGKFWPLAILDFKAGDPTELARMVRQYGLSPQSEIANFVADIVERKFKPTKRHKALEREYEVLRLVYSYDAWRRWAKENPNCIDRKTLSPTDATMRTMQDVYLRVAEELNMTADAVEKAVQRNRQRRRPQQ
jgi:hypothetical protein